MARGDVAQCRPELGDALARQPVVDVVAVPTGGDEPGAGEHLQVVGRVGGGLADLACQHLDRALALGEHVDQLGSTPVAERLGDVGEPVEESSPSQLRSAIRASRSASKGRVRDPVGSTLAESSLVFKQSLDFFGLRGIELFYS